MFTVELFLMINHSNLRVYTLKIGCSDPLVGKSGVALHSLFIVAALFFVVGLLAFVRSLFLSLLPLICSSSYTIQLHFFCQFYRSLGLMGILSDIRFIIFLLTDLGVVGFLFARRGDIAWRQLICQHVPALDCRPALHSGMVLHS